MRFGDLMKRNNHLANHHMKLKLAIILVVLVTIPGICFGQNRSLVAPIRGMDMDGPACWFNALGGVVFYGASFSNGDYFWMNIDGRNTRFDLNSRKTVGSRSIERYSASGITLNLVKTARKRKKYSSDYAVTLQVRKGNRTQSLRATGTCGD